MFTRILLVGSVFACASSWGLWASAKPLNLPTTVIMSCEAKGALDAQLAATVGANREAAYALGLQRCADDAAERLAEWSETDRAGAPPACWFGPEGSCETMSDMSAEDCAAERELNPLATCWEDVLPAASAFMAEGSTECER